MSGRIAAMCATAAALPLTDVALCAFMAAVPGLVVFPLRRRR